MTAPHTCRNGSVLRGLGWDISSHYSAPRGSFFSEKSFGHTGYSGTSIWIDPLQDLFVIVLTNRLNYRDTRVFNQLRSDISTVAAGFGSGVDHALPPWDHAAILADLMQRSATIPQPIPVTVKVAAVPKKSSRHYASSRHASAKKSGKMAKRKTYSRHRRA